MSAPRAKCEKLWRNRFHEPTVEQLLDECSRQFQIVIGHARSRLCGVEGMQEELRWLGVPLRWSLVFTHESEPDKAFAFLTLDPEGPCLTLPMPARVLAELGGKKLSRFVRDGLMQAPQVGTTRWGQWGLATKGAVDELMHIAEIRLPHAETRR